jgi:alcohol dehydrogenase class IV
MITVGKCRQGSDNVQFEFATAGQIVFGWGRIGELGQRTQAFGKRVLLVTGSRPERTESINELLLAVGADVATLSIATEPTTSMVQAGVECARDHGTDWVLGVGGGSVLDSAKAIAALVPNPGEIFEYLEVVGRGQNLAQASLPCVAAPTTSGTGSEVTKNAVLHATEHGVKVSLRGLGLLPRIALVDPELTVSLPADVTAATGLDALTQLIEPYVSVARGPMTDALCLEGMRRIAAAIRRVHTNGNDRAARENMAVGSLCGGLALANARLGAVHGFAAPLGGLCGAPHGAICARLLPLVMRANLKSVRELNQTDLVTRFTQIAKTLTGHSDAHAEDAIPWLNALVTDLGIQRLGSFGIVSSQVDSLVQQSRQASSMRGNPVELSSGVLAEILHEAI